MSISRWRNNIAKSCVGAPGKTPLARCGHAALFKWPDMIAIVTCALVIALIVWIVRCVAAVPLIRTLSASMDGWANNIHGRGAEDAP